MDEMKKKQGAVIMMALKRFSNEELAVFNIGIQGFGKIPPTSLAYRAALEGQLIKENGNPTFDLDIVQAASTAEVGRRMKEGGFA